jgi:hypothetical protein
MFVYVYILPQHDYLLKYEGTFSPPQLDDHFHGSLYFRTCYIFLCKEGLGRGKERERGERKRPAFRTHPTLQERRKHAHTKTQTT